MAEVFGVVASALAVAELTGKLGGSIMKMKKLWDEVQDVPENIKQLIRQLEILRPVLAEMEAEFVQQQHQVYHDSAANMSLQYCQQAVDDLEGLAWDLQNQITTAKRSRRNITKFKVSFKKEVISGYQERIQFALQLLSLSQQTYIFNAVKAQRMYLTACPQSSLSDATAEGSSAELEEAPPEQSAQYSVLLRGGHQQRVKPIPRRQASFFGNFVYQTSPHPKYGNTQVCQARLQLPWWISGRSWDFQAYRACTGWKVSLTSWITRPWDAPIFKCIKRGSWPEVLKLLNENQASLLDCDPEGKTLLHCALQALDITIAKNLVHLGLDLTTANSSDPMALDMAIWDWGAYLPNLEFNTVVEVLRFIMSSGELDEIIQDTFVPRGRSFRGFYKALDVLLWSIPDVLRILMGEGLTDYYRFTLETRFASLHWLWIDPRVFLEDLRCGTSVDPTAFRATAMHLPEFNDPSSLSQFARRYFDEVCILGLSEDDDKRFQSWRELARWILTDITIEELSGECTFAIESGCMSPLWTGLRFLRYPIEGTSTYVKRMRLRGLSQAMTTWLEDVQSCGIDLEEYGRQELDFLLDDEGLWLRRWHNLSLNPGDPREEDIGYGPRLDSFTFGPRPEDWALIWDPAVEEFAGEFWEFIENPPLHLPGAWVDDD